MGQNQPAGGLAASDNQPPAPVAEMRRLSRYPRVAINGVDGWASRNYKRLQPPEKSLTYDACRRITDTITTGTTMATAAIATAMTIMPAIAMAHIVVT